MDEPKKTIKLIHGIPVPTSDNGHIIVHEISLGRLKGKHIKNLSDDFFVKASEGKLNHGEMLKLIGGLADLPDSAIDEIDVIDDLPAIAKELESFLVGSPETVSNVSGG